MLLSILYIFLQAAKLLRQHVGVGAALFFGFGLLLIGCSKSGTGTPNTGAANLLTTVPSNAPFANASALKQVALGGSNQLFLRADYYTENGRITKPRGLYAGVSGFMLGHTWQPVTGFLEKRGNQLHYTAIINHHWSLLGVRVFTQSGELFEGVMPPAKN
ncbi:hypothetical protein BEN47_03930 [Hymenobacter lapidarius]|uniref:Uncharacterized protein n=1 Tax=Hymenobacter lapidarius TaxID=1908237 RepID=A0A1G1SXU1_9BACT|nr:hypothetical protein BEN47_03930 [Hymenobacter lapidarius]